MVDHMCACMVCVLCVHEHVRACECGRAFAQCCQHSLADSAQSFLVHCCSRGEQLTNGALEERFSLSSFTNG